MWPPYEIIDDFLSAEHLSLAENMDFDTGPLDWDVYNHTIDLESNVVSNFLRRNTQFKHVKSYNPGYHNLSDETVINMRNLYEPKLKEVLQRLAPEKVEHHTHTTFNIVNVGKDYVFRIHSDKPDKLLTTVIYISDYNEGTWLYDSEDGENARQVDWLKNRAFSFSRNENAWHSYKSDGIKTRRTLVISLRSDM